MGKYVRALLVQFFLILVVTGGSIALILHKYHTLPYLLGPLVFLVLFLTLFVWDPITVRIRKYMER